MYETGEIYVDADLQKPSCFSLFNLAHGERCLFVDGSERTVYRPDTLHAAERALGGGFQNGGYGDAEGCYAGDTLQVSVKRASLLAVGAFLSMSCPCHPCIVHVVTSSSALVRVGQVGGVFVMGPGNVCDFSHRGSYAGALADWTSLCGAVHGGGADQEGEVEGEVEEESSESSRLKWELSPSLPPGPTPTHRPQRFTWIPPLVALAGGAGGMAVAVQMGFLRARHIPAAVAIVIGVCLSVVAWAILQSEGPPPAPPTEAKGGGELSGGGWGGGALMSVLEVDEAVRRLGRAVMTDCPFLQVFVCVMGCVM